MPVNPLLQAHAPLPAAPAQSQQSEQAKQDQKAATPAITDH